jgi:subtilisin family serine protease
MVFPVSLLLIVLCFATFNPYNVIAQTHDSARKQRILNAISQKLQSRLAAGEPQEVIVEFDSAGVEVEAGTLRAQKRLMHYDRDIVEFKSQRFRQIKDSALARIPATDADVLIDYSHLPMVHLRLRVAAALDRLIEFTEVLAVNENGTVYPHLSQSLPLISQPQAANAGYKGAGTTVAVLDTGVNYTRAEFGYCTAPGVPVGCKVIEAVEIAADDNSLDDNGHGTNISAIVVGAAPDSLIAGLDVFNPDGTATDALVISGINWAIANQATYNIVSINMSLGDNTKYTSFCSNQFTNPYVTPVNQARAAGILPVASSGNKGYTNGISRPACTPGIISVGAVYDANIGGVSYSVCTDAATAADQITCFSNSASFLTMLAPGAAITAGGYTKYGTSQAAPHVAGAVAVLRAVYPSESIDATTSRLTSSGQMVTDTHNGIEKPRLDLYNSLGIEAEAVPALSGYSLVGVILVLIVLGVTSGRKQS